MMKKFRPGDLVYWKSSFGPIDSEGDTIGLILSKEKSGHLRVYWMWKSGEMEQIDSCVWLESLDSDHLMRVIS